MRRHLKPTAMETSNESHQRDRVTLKPFPEWYLRRCRNFIRSQHDCRLRQLQSETKACQAGTVALQTAEFPPGRPASQPDGSAADQTTESTWLVARLERRPVWNLRGGVFLCAADRLLNSGDHCIGRTIQGRQMRSCETVLRDLGTNWLQIADQWNSRCVRDASPVVGIMTTTAQCPLRACVRGWWC